VKLRHTLPPQPRLPTVALATVLVMFLAAAALAAWWHREATATEAGAAPADVAAEAIEAGAVDAELEAPSGFEPYIFRTTGERADPVNIIFLHTDAATTAEAAQRLLGWRQVVAAGMNFKEKGGGARPTSRQLAADLAAGSRFHLRIQSVPQTDTQTYVLASVHRDDPMPCGHVGRAFDETRDLVARAFADAGYRTRYVDLQNTNSGLHCDGSRVAGDGRAVLIDLSSVPRADITRGRIPGAY